MTHWLFAGPGHERCSLDYFLRLRWSVACELYRPGDALTHHIDHVTCPECLIALEIRAMGRAMGGQ